MSLKRFYHPIKYDSLNIAALGLLLFFSNYCLSSEIQDLTTELKAIDQKHQNFSTKFYSKFSSHASIQLQSFQNIDSLEKVISSNIGKDRTLATGLIMKNLPMLKNNYDSLAIIEIMKILLEQNEFNSAKKLFELLKQDGDIDILSNITYLFANFSFQRKEWAQTLNYLDNAVNDLSGEDYNHALLIKGISLQKLAEHRKSITEYEKISLSSKYYPSARINMAIANIRQGWWTDGHNLIKNLLQKSEGNSLNRLYLILGYSFLKQEYYRNSRESFRNVGLNSPYTNRALLGIALTAANQKDYIGALNAVRILKKKNTSDLPVDESHLLMPYFYEKLQQHTTASTGYSQAVSYYQRRVAGIYNTLQSEIKPSQYPIILNGIVTTNINNNLVKFSPTYPNYFFNNYLVLKSYSTQLAKINNQKLNNDFLQLKTEYETIIIKMINNLLKQKIEQLNSYMDQSRFGLARLYDNNLVNK